MWYTVTKLNMEGNEHMYNLTQKAQAFFLSFGSIFTDRPSDPDLGIKEFCKSEYGNDWYWAYKSYKTDGRFPNILISEINRGIHK